MTITLGIKGRNEITVEREMTALAMGSGELEVFATPSMIALMEKTAMESIKEYLDEGIGSVGTRIDISHTSPTPMGMKVVCESEVIEIDGRRIVFSLRVYDECGTISEGTHERFIISNDKFIAKAKSKAVR